MAKDVRGDQSVSEQMRPTDPQPLHPPIPPQAPESPRPPPNQKTPEPRKITLGRTVHVTDHHPPHSIHPAIVTYANDDQSIVATVFKTNETLIGVGFTEAEGNLASPGRWHWPV